MKYTANQWSFDRQVECTHPCLMHLDCKRTPAADTSAGKKALLSCSMEERGTVHIHPFADGRAPSSEAVSEPADVNKAACGGDRAP